MSAGRILHTTAGAHERSGHSGQVIPRCLDVSEEGSTRPPTQGLNGGVLDAHFMSRGHRFDTETMVRVLLARDPGALQCRANTRDEAGLCQRGPVLKTKEGAWAFASDRSRAATGHRSPPAASTYTAAPRQNWSVFDLFKYMRTQVGRGYCRPV